MKPFVFRQFTTMSGTAHWTILQGKSTSLNIFCLNDNFGLYCTTCNLKKKIIKLQFTLHNESIFV